MATKAFKTNAHVTWRTGMKPVKAPYTDGTVFLSKGRETWVLWTNGPKTPQCVFTGALEVKKGK